MNSGLLRAIVARYQGPIDAARAAWLERADDMQGYVEALVEPWLGEAASSDIVTLPAVIEVRLTDGSDPGAIARLRGILEPFPFEHDDVVDVVGQCSRRQQPGTEEHDLARTEQLLRDTLVSQSDFINELVKRAIRQCARQRPHAPNITAGFQACRDSESVCRSRVKQSKARALPQSHLSSGHGGYTPVSVPWPLAQNPASSNVISTVIV